MKRALVSLLISLNVPATILAMCALIRQMGGALEKYCPQRMITWVADDAMGKALTAYKEFCK